MENMAQKKNDPPGDEEWTWAELDRGGGDRVWGGMGPKAGQTGGGRTGGRGKGASGGREGPRHQAGMRIEEKRGLGKTLPVDAGLHSQREGGWCPAKDVKEGNLGRVGGKKFPTPLRFFS